MIKNSQNWLKEPRLRRENTTGRKRAEIESSKRKYEKNNAWIDEICTLNY